MRSKLLTWHLKLLTNCGFQLKKSWRLNERHYGGLTGKNKAEAAEQFGDEQVHIWRRSYDVLPPAMDRDDEHSAHTDRRYASLDDSVIPDAENLKVTLERAPSILGR